MLFKNYDQHSKKIGTLRYDACQLDCVWLENVYGLQESTVLKRVEQK
ncbi:hypothetical protein CZ794_13600 [Psychrobacter sp. JB385]|nr:hypothetical protein CZ794_13600 [Psychrobacter sp. JB385]